MPRATTVAGAAVIVVAGLIALRVAKSDTEPEADPVGRSDAGPASELEPKAQALGTAASSAKGH